MGENLVSLGEKDLELIIDLEKSSWVPLAQANKETISKRFDLGHKMFGIIVNWT